jgi:hypothetical protein
MSARAQGLLPPDRSSDEWTPPSLPRFREGGFHYVVVDEIVGPTVGLTLSAWPRLDGQGRLRFSENGVYLVGSPIDELERFVGEHRLPEELRDRPLRVGDVFAVRVKPSALRGLSDEANEEQRLEPFLEPERWIEPPLYDVTADARDASKAAFYAAVTPTLESGLAAQLAEPRPSPDER